MLLGERPGKLLGRHVTPFEKVLSQQAAVASLREQHALKAALREQLAGHEDAAERAPLPGGLRGGGGGSCFGGEMNAVLLGDHRGYLDRRDDALTDEQLSEELPAQALLEQERLELVLVDEAPLDEELSEGPPCVFRHRSRIGRTALSQ